MNPADPIIILRRVVEKLTPAVTETLEQHKPREVVLHFDKDGNFEAFTKYKL